jgi:hypothetical protein
MNPKWEHGWRRAAETGKVPPEFAKLGIWVNILAAQLQEAGAQSFVKPGNDLMEVIGWQCTKLKQTD